MIMPIVNARGLTKEYGTLKAVDAVSFDILEGECFGLLGPNGAGKTTVLRVISCFTVPSAGKVTVFGLDVIGDPSAIKSRIGVMPQDDNLDPDLTVFENLMVYARYFDVSRKEASRRSGELLRFVELEEKATSHIRTLSGGMKHRLLLARSLINGPELLVLDEPTTGLDPHSRRAVWDKLEDLQARGTTLVLTTHYMEEAERLCDRVAIMDTGRIVTTETPRDLMAAHGGHLEDVYLKLTGRPLED